MSDVFAKLSEMQDEEAELVDAARSHRDAGIENVGLAHKLGYVRRDIRALLKEMSPEEREACQKIKRQTGEINRMALKVAQGKRAQKTVELLVQDMKEYLPPDGITKDEFINRVVGRLDPPTA